MGFIKGRNHIRMVMRRIRMVMRSPSLCHRYREKNHADQKQSLEKSDFKPKVHKLLNNPKL